MDHRHDQHRIPFPSVLINVMKKLVNYEKGSKRSGSPCPVSGRHKKSIQHYAKPGKMDGFRLLGAKTRNRM